MGALGPADREHHNPSQRFAHYLRIGEMFDLDVPQSVVGEDVLQIGMLSTYTRLRGRERGPTLRPSVSGHCPVYFMYLSLS